MRFDLTIAQAWLTRAGDAPAVPKARSPGVRPEWDADLAALVEGLGPRGVGPAGGVFAHPLGRGHVAVGQVLAGADLAVRLLIFARPTYERLGDPFALADLFPATSLPTGSDLDDLAVPEEGLPRRTVEGLLALFHAHDLPLLLGSAQALLDGNRLAFTAEVPPESLRAVWQLLPDRARAELWPATYAPAPTLNFDAMILPAAPEPAPGVLSADQARDYPEGRYELALQSAVESQDAAELARLLARRTSREVQRLAFLALTAVVLGMFALTLARRAV